MSKFYVVWEGRNPGIYETWEDCKSQTMGFKGSSFKSYLTKAEAESAYQSGSIKNANASLKPNALVKRKQEKCSSESFGKSLSYPNMNTISVDAACSGNPGPMEYRGVWTNNPEKEIFHFGPMEGTNNIGEFLAIVEGLKYLKLHSLDIPLYTDSVTALKWVRTKNAATTLKNTEKTFITFKLIKEAIDWLNTNTYETKIIKWDTKYWGEIKADFGRK